MFFSFTVLPYGAAYAKEVIRAWQSDLRDIHGAARGYHRWQRACCFVYSLSPFISRLRPSKPSGIRIYERRHR